jgi:hypothetical protein
MTKMGYFFISWSEKLYYVVIDGLKCTIYDIEDHVAVELLFKRIPSIDDISMVTVRMEIYGADMLDKVLGRNVEVLKVYRYEPRRKKEKTKISKEA